MQEGGEHAGALRFGDAAGSHDFVKNALSIVEPGRRDFRSVDSLGRDLGAERSSEIGAVRRMPALVTRGAGGQLNNERERPNRHQSSRHSSEARLRLELDPPTEGPSLGGDSPRSARNLARVQAHHQPGVPPPGVPPSGLDTLPPLVVVFWPAPAQPVVTPARMAPPATSTWNSLRISMIPPLRTVSR